ncbi:hypothetical protein [Agromyces bauzanensis]
MNYPIYPADPARDPAEPFRNLDPAPRTGSVTIVEPRPGTWDAASDGRPLTAEEVIERQWEQFGGVKVGSAFFGWLIAAATAAIITGAAAAGGAALRLGKLLTPATSTGLGPFDAPTVGWIGVGILLAVVLVAFYCGGYVAGRMARFSGVVQGLAVWIWAIVIAIAVVLLGVVLALPYEAATDRLVLFSGLLVPDDLVMIAGIVAAVAGAVVSLGGALLGGMAGVRYHRRVDRVGLAA